ncbi:MAG: PKD domain-containing protein [Candidatus Bipolaricaulis sp.]|nr:PKD domain-containing protein [Candidatus Bipolaricaulis sp.]MDD5219256.1 PKD domain-containing protein [Candidatus Bipolaricaulis sp.]
MALHGTLPARGYILLERTDDHTVDDVPADLLFTGTLENSGEVLRLRDAEGRVVDSVDCGEGWFAGESSPSYATMERVNPERSGIASNWRTNDGVTRNGCDAGGRPLSGTPKAANSATKPPVAAFSTIPEQATIWGVLRFVDLSLDADGQVVSWRWEFGDGATSAAPNPTHPYHAPGVYTAVLTVEDADGLVARSERSIVVCCGRGDLNTDDRVDLLDVLLALACAQSDDSTCGEAADVDDARRLAEFVLGL